VTDSYFCGVLREHISPKEDFDEPEFASGTTENETSKLV
jgi:hypothetical protein